MPFAHLLSVVTGREISHFGWTLPAAAAVVLTGGVMVLLAVLVERLVLRHLINQAPIVLFMATIGLAYFLEGLGDLMWGADVKAVDVGLPQGGSLWFEELTKGWAPADAGYWGMYVDKLDVVAALVAAALVAGLTLFSPGDARPGGRCARWPTTIRRRCRSGSAAHDLGDRLVDRRARRAGGRGDVGGAVSGVQFSLSLIALKALPVLILGGFTSIPGAIVGGLIIGVGEKVFELSVGPLIGGATENWFAYVLALVFLLVRPQGLFGERIIERV